MAKLTEKAILQTFDDMIHEMPFEKITVSALVARCGISSNTFYYHYQDIYALVDAWLGGRLKKYARDAYLTDDWKSVLKNCVRELQKNPKVVSHLFNSISRGRMERYIFQVLEPAVYQMIWERVAQKHVSEQTQHMLVSAFCYSLCGFILKFIYEGMKADIDEMFDPIIDFLEKSIIHYAAQELKDDGDAAP